MWSRMHSEVEVRPNGAPGVGTGADGRAPKKEALGKDWWLENFGIFVEPSIEEFKVSGISTYRIWEVKNGVESFHISYGDDAGKLWVRMRALAERLK